MGWNKRLELLTPSATNLCAANCANSTTAFLVYRFFSKKSIVFCKKLNNTKQKYRCCNTDKKLFYFIFDNLNIYDIIWLFWKIVRVVECACLENRCGAIHHRFKSCIFRQLVIPNLVWLFCCFLIFRKLYCANWVNRKIKKSHKKLKKISYFNKKSQKINKKRLKVAFYSILAIIL